MSTPPTAVSVIVTVLDEARSIERLLDSLAAQTQLPDEVVVVDGGSTDGTFEQLERRSEDGALPLVVLRRPGANISAGRNMAIETARGPIIASTDAGVRLQPTWLERLVAPIRAGEARVSSGFFVSDPDGVFQTALGAVTLPDSDEVDPRRFLPSSRSVAFLKADWTRCGGYPEWLDYCEDLVFDMRLLEVAGPAAFAPEAVTAFRPRPSLGAFFRQYYRYARGDGKADLWRGRHAIRYAVYLMAGPLLVGLALVVDSWWWLPLLLGAALYVRRPFLRLRRRWAPLSPEQRLRALLWLPLLRVVGDVAKMLGYPVGWWWRLRHRPPAWRPS